VPVVVLCLCLCVVFSDLFIVEWWYMIGSLSDWFIQLALEYDWSIDVKAIDACDLFGGSWRHAFVC
jgi:hypothetical protein